MQWLWTIAPKVQQNMGSLLVRISIWTHISFFLISNKSAEDISLSLTMSSMARATETAQIILKHFPNMEGSSCDLIQEGAPCEPVSNG